MPAAHCHPSLLALVQQCHGLPFCNLVLGGRFCDLDLGGGGKDCRATRPCDRSLDWPGPLNARTHLQVLLNVGYALSEVGGVLVRRAIHDGHAMALMQGECGRRAGGHAVTGAIKLDKVDKDVRPCKQWRLAERRAP